MRSSNSSGSAWTGLSAGDRNDRFCDDSVDVGIDWSGLPAFPFGVPSSCWSTISSSETCSWDPRHDREYNLSCLEPSNLVCISTANLVGCRRLLCKFMPRYCPAPSKLDIPQLPVFLRTSLWVCSGAGDERRTLWRYSGHLAGPARSSL